DYFCAAWDNSLRSVLF
nr:immunoglobulin light chain junction region [Macaca mulatta]MOV94684.1 immunoglobulin light chain junction region [Macaca mulatta]MOV94958.1 immunoglobulin light chain junction region [Macaca mulatta]MOV95044.1 immunoglobulin light chain junction region [Macaca mulatta]MOV95054.1 immunoglobulin light chain junction region [Macaca mulatta]